MGFEFILNTVLPCWYELSWDKETPAIILRIHNDFVADQDVIKDDAPIVKHFLKELGFKEWYGALGKDFGFEKCLSINESGERENYHEYRINIPQVEFITDEPCHDCEGSGKNQYFSDEKCMWCQGGGREKKLFWQPLIEISASLNIFFSLAKFYEGKTRAKTPQMLTVATRTKIDMHGGSLDGEYSILMVDYLCSLAVNERIIGMEKAMLETYKKIFNGLGYNNEYEFRAWVKADGWLNVSCPGDACGLNPMNASYRWSAMRGYEFGCHNVDNLAQQLTLLAGLAALSDKAREFYWERGKDELG